jgi:serine protease
MVTMKLVRSSRRALKGAVGAIAMLSAVLGATGGAVAAGANAGAALQPCPPAAGLPGLSGRAGVMPTIGRLQTVRTCAGSPQTSDLMFFHGGNDGIGVTSGTPKVYLVFWGSQWGTPGTDKSGNLTFSNDYDAGAPYIQNLMKGLGTGGETWSGTMTQYCDGPLVAVGATSCPAGAPRVGYPDGSALAGVWYDNSAEPPAATFSEIDAEAVSAAAHFGNSTAASNRYAQYVVLSAPGLDPDNYRTSGFCAWHSATSSSAGDIAFTNMPYVMDVGWSCGQGFVNSPGTNDGYSIVEGHEYTETVTDQIPIGGWTDGGFGENGDKCVWISFGQGAAADVATATGSFAMQSTFSNDTDRCDIAHPIFQGGGPAVEIPGTGFAIPGSLGSVSIPSVEKWVPASDSNGICSYDLRESVAGGPFNEVTLGSPTATSVALSLDPTTSYSFELNVTNCLGQSSGWGVQPSFTPLAWQETNRKLNYNGTWTTQSTSSAYGGALKYATASNASVSATFQGTGVAWVSETGPTLGTATVYLDGVKQKTVNLYSSTVHPRQVVWKQGWSIQTAHVIKIVVSGTAGHPRVDLDTILTFHLQ